VRSRRRAAANRVLKHLLPLLLLLPPPPPLSRLLHTGNLEIVGDLYATK
jgi:hypothetical protein